MKRICSVTLLLLLAAIATAQPPVTDRDGSVVYPSGDTTGARDTITLQEELTDSGNILLSPGIYYIDGTISVFRQDDVSIVGRGVKLVQLAEKAITLDVKQCDGVVVRGIHFHGLGTETPWDGPPEWNGVAGVVIRSVHNALVSQCTFTNHAGASIVLYGAAPGIRIIGNSITGMGSDVISAGDNGGDGAIRSGATGHHLNGCIISNNVISGHAFGILAPQGNGFVILGNVIRDIPGQHGIYMTNGADCVIANNVVTNCAEHGIKVQHQSPEDQHWVVNVTGNTVSHIGYDGIWINPAGDGVGYFTHNVAITGNNVHDCRMCMRLRYAKSIFVTNNRISGYREQPMELREVSGVVANNYVSAPELEIEE